MVISINTYNAGNYIFFIICIFLNILPVRQNDHVDCELNFCTFGHKNEKFFIPFEYRRGVLKDLNIPCMTKFF